MYLRWFVENGLTFVGCLLAKLETCKECELSGEGRGKSAHYWFTGMEEGQAEEGMMVLKQNTLRQLKMSLIQGVCPR